tara:strand:- start:2511 stop:3167 length:657 start_codon:yes stop_codon:yes gene_type:complete
MANTIQIFANNASKGTATADVSGNWTKTITLTANDYNLKAQSTDPAGNTSGNSGLIYIRTGETETPSAPDLLDDSGSSSTDNITNDQTPRIAVKVELGWVSATLTPSDDVVKAILVERKLGSGSYASAGTILNSSLTKTDNSMIKEKSYSGTLQESTLSDGVYTYRCKWNDKNNVGSSYSSELAVTIDSTAPSAPAITSITSGAVIFGTSVAVAGTSS